MLGSCEWHVHIFVVFVYLQAASFMEGTDSEKRHKDLRQTVIVGRQTHASACFSHLRSSSA